MTVIAVLLDMDNFKKKDVEPFIKAIGFECETEKGHMTSINKWQSKWLVYQNSYNNEYLDKKIIKSTQYDGVSFMIGIGYPKYFNYNKLYPVTSVEVNTTRSGVWKQDSITK